MRQPVEHEPVEHEPLRLDENAGARTVPETRLQALPTEELAGLLRATRQAAALARGRGDLATLIEHVRAMKTLHRLAAERGAVLPRRTDAGLPPPGRRDDA